MRDAARARSSRRPTGALLVTGPTGSGKSTTLYAALDARSTGPRSTSSPSRTRSSTGSPGVNQVQINPRAGLTFATALRSILRSDPDVVMVGEIRDGETAKISIEAALTGHLVLSTLHTNDAPGRAHAPERDGRRAVPHRLRRLGRARPAPRAQALHALLRDVHADVDELIEARVSPEVAAARGRHGASTASAAARAATRPATRAGSAIFQLLDDERRARAARRPRRRRRDEIERAAIGDGHADALGRRHRQGRRRPHVARRARPRHRLAGPERLRSNRLLLALEARLRCRRHVLDERIRVGSTRIADVEQHLRRRLLRCGRRWAWPPRDHARTCSLARAAKALLFSASQPIARQMSRRDVRAGARAQSISSISSHRDPPARRVPMRANAARAKLTTSVTASRRNRVLVTDCYLSGSGGLDVAAEVHQGLDGFRHERGCLAGARRTCRARAARARRSRSGRPRPRRRTSSPWSTARMTAIERPSRRACRTNSSRPALPSAALTGRTWRRSRRPGRPCRGRRSR